MAISVPAIDPNEFSQLDQQANQLYSQQHAPAQATHHGPGGLAGFLVNNLPAITSGVGAVGGSFFGPGVGTVAGGAAGGALGEALKRKLLGQKEDVGQIVTQGLEGGALSALGGAARGVKAGAQALTKLGTEEAATTAAKTAEQKAGGGFLKNLTTQGQQAQGRVSGISAGQKVAGKELTPQDTEQMLNTLRTEGIQTGNANNTLRDITDKLKGYGQQISDHFKANAAPLRPEDTKVIANNYLSGLTTTDPGVLKQADILANDLQKNVKSTEDLWKFRKSLDSRIPDAKMAAGNNELSNKLVAIKNMRQYIASELGDVPGMQNYHDLAEIKPFVSGEARRLNNPGGGIVGRVLSSGPVQKIENAVGKGVEKIGQVGTEAAPTAAPTAAAPTQNLAQRFIGAAATPIANPGKTAGAVLKQEAGRGFGIPAGLTAATQAAQAPGAPGTEPDLTGAIQQASSDNQGTSNDPYSPENVQANVQAIMQQGGKQSDVAAYLANVKAYQALTNPSGSKLNATQQQQANNAVSGLQDIQSLASMLQQNPSLTTKAGIPGSSNSIVQRLTGTTDYEAAKNNIVDVISRLRSGAAISASEEKLYKSLLPAAGDTPESANSKLSRLSTLLSSFAQPQAAGGSDVTDLLANAGG